MSERKYQFTQRARNALALAQEEADRHNRKFISTEHLLMGLFREQQGAAGHLLRELGLDPNQLELLMQSYPRFSKRSDIPLIVLGQGGRILFLNQPAQDIIDSHPEGFSDNFSQSGNELPRIYVGDKSYLVTSEQQSDARTIVILQDESLRQRYERVFTILAYSLKEHLALLLGYVQLLRDGADLDEQVQRWVERLSIYGVKMNGMVDEMAYMSRVLDTHEIARHPCDLGETISREVANLPSASDVRSVRLSFDGPIERCQIWGDENDLSHMISNLISNAISRSSDGQEVRLILTRDEAGIRLSVRDSGPGIRDDEAQYVFFPYSQTGHMRESHEMGLSLAVVKTIVEAHGWTIEVNNLPEGGAEFVVIFPPTSVLPPDA